MTYNELKDICKKYSKIIVSGPQRSGTTYMSHILSKDLGYTKIDEKDYDVHEEKKFLEYLKKQNVVVQSPAMTHILHELEGGDILILFMIRNDDDIIKSENRINFHPLETKREKKKYDAKFPNLNLTSFNRNSKLKKHVWETVQKDKLKCEYLEVPFEILKETSEYVKKEKRKDFKAKQIK